MDYEKFLVENEILPIDCKTGKWNHFKVNHLKPKDDISKNQVKTFIESNVANRNGLYIYKNEKGEILYIGKGKPLKNRLYSHYLESFQPVRGDTKDQRWHKFFLKHQGLLDVYWLELEGEKDRQIIEKMLDYLLKPLFNEKALALDSTNHNQSINNTIIKKEKNKQNETSYQFLHYGEELIEKVHASLGPDFTPEYRATGVTFYHGFNRILKLVSATNHLKVEYNVQVPKVDDLIVLTKEEAKEKKMGTCQWIYKGRSLDMAMHLVREAKKVFMGKC